MAKYLLLILLCSLTALSQDLPEDELQVDMNAYFDSYNVSIVYPEISVTKSVSPTTAVNARYLVDIITAASMKSHFDNVFSLENVREGLDAYTSATPKDYGGGDDIPDELRHEFVAGVTQFLGDVSLSLNNIYSTEHDYSSETIAASVTIPLAKKNTIINLGATKSWDKIFPQIRNWERKKDVVSFNLAFTQIFSTRFLSQVEVYYSNMNGFLSDPYQVVTVADFQNNILDYYEPISPDERNRYAVSMRSIYGLNDISSLTFAYRYYTDDWDINSHTLHGMYKRLFIREQINTSFGFRAYTQTKADFFKENYFNAEDFMAVDPKLDDLYSLEFQFKFGINSSIIPYINNENIELNSRMNIFYRHSNTPDWHSRYKDLYAIIFSVGVKYLF